jgi:hypothetical protein
VIEKITTYLEDALEVDIEDNNVLGRCLTRDANVVGS